MQPESTRACRAAAVLALGAAFACAQDDQSEGPLLVIAQGFSVDAASVIPGANGSTLLFTRSEFSGNAPSAWTPTPGLPDYSTVLGGLPLDVDGISLGLDYIQSTPAGLALVPPGHWAAITFSVTRTTTGTAGGEVADEAGKPGGAAADVFFYVLPGSALPFELVDRTMRSQDSMEIDVGAAATPGNIDAHDVYLSLIYRENPQLVPFVPLHSVFFSVTAASVPLVPAGWWGGAPPSGATILRRDWIGGAWSPVYPAFAPADFGLAPLEDVDGLAVDVLRGHVLLSTTRPSATPGAPLRDPVLYHRIGVPGNSVYMAATSPVAPVSVRLGLAGPGGIDDVDGICALDPGAGSQPRLDRVIGTPQPRIFPAPARIDAAVHRRAIAGGTIEQFVTHMAGWPTPNTPLPGLAFLGIALGSALNTYTTAAGFLRPDPLSPYFPFEGHPHHYVLTLPNNPIFFGVDVFFTWAAFDGLTLDVSFPVGVRV